VTRSTAGGKDSLPSSAGGAATATNEVTKMKTKRNIFAFITFFLLVLVVMTKLHLATTKSPVLQQPLG
jgi:hypothetical protein